MTFKIPFFIKKKMIASYSMPYLIEYETFFFKFFDAKMNLIER